jgi:hypothetical protein
MLTPEERALITDMKDRQAAKTGTAIEFATCKPRSSAWPLSVRISAFGRPMDRA